jgi:hypothetical protein
LVPFTAPTSLGLQPITSYTVKCVNTAAVASPTCASTGTAPAVVTQTVAVGTSPLQTTFTGLPNSAYVCWIIENNGVAPGDVCSLPSNYATVATGPPSTPGISTPTSSGPGLLTVPVSAPTNLGTPAITSLTVKCVSTSVASPSCASTGSGVYTTSVPLTASPLQAALNVAAGDTYVCYGIADNGVGGPQCSSASSVAAVTGPPSPPTIGSIASTSTGSLTVPWSAPTSLGLPPITSYMVKCVDVTAVPTATCATAGSAPAVVTTTVAVGPTTLSYTFTGLTGSDAYRCWIIENNSIAPGDVCSQPSNVAYIVGAPNAPTMLTPTSSGVGQLSVPFTPSTVLGSPAITYTSVKCINTAVTTASCGATGTGVYSTTVAIGATPTASFASLPGGSYVCYAGERRETGVGERASP